METYRVVSITDRKGNPRIEGRLPSQSRENVQETHSKKRICHDD